MPSAGVDAALERALELLEDYGLLLLSDTRLPSVVALIAGGPIGGSWWGHAQGANIYTLLQRLDHHPDVATAKLLSGKTTYVHRSLWESLVCVGSAREAWQTRGLSDAGTVLLDLVTRDEEVRTDAVAWIVDPRRGKSGDAARDLERRLLVHSDEVHTESGAHAKVLQTWPAGAQAVGVVSTTRHPDDARRTFDTLVERLNAEFAGTVKTPWSVSAAARRYAR